MRFCSFRFTWSVLLGALLVGTAVAQAGPIEIRIQSLSKSGEFTWTCDHTNVHAGLQYTDALDNPWFGVPGYWNFVVTNTSNTVQFPPNTLSSPQLFLRMVASTNDLGSGYPAYSVTRRTITVDGSFSDWAGISPAVTDPAGDANNLPGSDITALYVARDNNNVYFRMDLATGPPSPSLFYGLDFKVDDAVGDRFVFIHMSAFRCTVDQWDSDVAHTHFAVATGQLAVNQNQIEFSVPSSALNLPVPSLVHAWDDTSGPSIDQTTRFEALWP